MTTTPKNAKEAGFKKITIAELQKCDFFSIDGKALRHSGGTMKNPNRKERLFKDTIHGFQAKCEFRNTAWMLIRAKCLELKLEVPTFDKIIEVKPR